MPMPRLGTALAALALFVLASACTVTFLPPGDAPPPSAAERPQPPAATEPVRPQPPRPVAGLPSDADFFVFEVGPSTIYPSDQLYFRVQVLRPGYLTVSAMAPNGRVVVLLSDVAIGVLPITTILPRADSRTPVLASGPVGAWRVFAQLTPAPAGARYGGLQGLDAWTGAIAANLARFDRASVIESAYEVRSR